MRLGGRAKRCFSFSSFISSLATISVACAILTGTPNRSWADEGGAYTYFDQKTGSEFSVTLGFTYNFENEHTNYQNGVDMHLDWGAPQFLTKQWQVGVVGHWYNQLCCDSGS